MSRGSGRTKTGRCQEIVDEIKDINKQIKVTQLDLADHDISAAKRKQLQELLRRLLAFRAGLQSALAKCRALPARVRLR